MYCICVCKQHRTNATTSQDNHEMSLKGTTISTGWEGPGLGWAGRRGGLWRKQVCQVCSQAGIIINGLFKSNIYTDLCKHIHLSMRLYLQ